MKLRAIRSAVPDTLWNAKKVSELIGAELDFLIEKVGVAERYILGPNETGTDLSEKACLKLFEATGLEPKDIGLVVVVTQTPDHGIPHNSALLQSRLGVPTTCAAFDISLGCSGYVYALSVCKGLMDVQNIQNALLVTCDPYSKIMDRHDRGTMAVFGDGATASWISNEEGAEIGIADMGTDGSYSDYLIVKAGRAAAPILSVHDNDVVTPKKDEARLHMFGRGIFNFVLSNVPKSIDSALELNSLTRNDIDYYALHQGSFYMLNSLAQRAKIPKEKMEFNIQKYGNTVSSSVPMLIETIIADGRAKPGTKILTSGFGVGLSWATNVLTF